MNKTLSIYLVTYNRKTKLKETLDCILSFESPVHNCSITVLDNNSNDGTSELLIRYSKKFKNLKYIKHHNNIGGNANICRAFELGLTSQSDYFWVLCDDDKYSFDHWFEIEALMNANTPIICVSDYIFPDKSSRNDPSYQLFQLTFVPAGIYKTDAIDADVLISMYDSIYTMFSQSCISISAINKNQSIKTSEHAVVYNGLHYEDKTDDVSYTRGSNPHNVIARRKDQVWIVGFCNILSLLKDKKLAERVMEISIPYKDIYASWDNFNNCMRNSYYNEKKINYFYEVVNCLPEQRKKCLLDFCSSVDRNCVVDTNKNIPIVPYVNNISKFFQAKYLLSCIFSIKESKDNVFYIIKFLGLRIKINKSSWWLN